MFIIISELFFKKLTIVDFMVTDRIITLQYISLQCPESVMIFFNDF